MVYISSGDQMITNMAATPPAQCLGSLRFMKALDMGGGGGERRGTWFV